MKKQLYARMQSQLEEFLTENFTIKLDFDIDEKVAIKAQINTSEALNDDKLDGLSELQEEWDFENKTLSRSGNGIRIVMTVK